MGTLWLGCFVVASGAMLALLFAQRPPQRREEIGIMTGGGVDQQGFDALMRTLARAWSTGDARAAVDCFSDDIVYVEPPDRQRYVGRSAVFELSGGGEPSAMSMTWHHLAFDPEAQIGFGEYTFRGRRQFHGVVIVQIRHDRIRRWREYQYHDELDWIQFIGDSRFEAT